MIAFAYENSRNGFALCGLVIGLSTVGFVLSEAWLLRVEPLVAIAVLVSVYFLAAIRIFPWRTPFRKAFSIGILLGTIVVLGLWKYGLTL